MTEDELRQRAYYTATAARYDGDHGAEDVEHTRALRHVLAVIRTHGLRSGLDVGAGTGRALRFMATAAPELDIHGIEPVQALIDVAQRQHGIAPGRIQPGSGLDLPFVDGSFDFVLAQAVMHHVPEPATVISEMLRVARRAVFVVDTNRFANGSSWARVTKLALAKTGLWETFYRLKTRGRGYRISEGDGLAYSYSVYDSLRLVENWGDEVQMISITARSQQRMSFRWCQPLLTSQTVLMYAVRAESQHGPTR